MIETTVMLLYGAATWNLAGAQAPAATQPAHWLTYQSRDLFFVVERPSGWEYRTTEDSNEVIFQNGNISVSVAAANNDDDNSVEQFLEVNKSLLRQQCPAAEMREEGKTTVAGIPGAYFTMFCLGPRLPTIVRISAALNYGKFFIFNVTAPGAELPTVQADIDHMAQSFKAGDGLPEGREPRKQAK
jgi:hypothetical protein